MLNIHIHITLYQVVIPYVMNEIKIEGNLLQFVERKKHRRRILEDVTLIKIDLKFFLANTRLILRVKNIFVLFYIVTLKFLM